MFPFHICIRQPHNCWTQNRGGIHDWPFGHIKSVCYAELMRGRQFHKTHKESMQIKKRSSQEQEVLQEIVDVLSGNEHRIWCVQVGGTLRIDSVSCDFLNHFKDSGYATWQAIPDLGTAQYNSLLPYVGASLQHVFHAVNPMKECCGRDLL